MNHKGIESQVIRYDAEVLIEIPIEYHRFEEEVTRRLKTTFGEINHGPDTDAEVVNGVDVGVFYYYITAELYEGFDGRAFEALALAEVLDTIAACEAAEERLRNER